jgi:hypothetical protein
MTVAGRLLPVAPVTAGVLLELAEDPHAAVRTASATALRAVTTTGTPRCAVNLAGNMRTPTLDFTTPSYL